MTDHLGLQSSRRETLTIIHAVIIWCFSVTAKENNGTPEFNQFLQALRDAERKAHYEVQTRTLTCLAGQNRVFGLSDVFMSFSC